MLEKHQKMSDFIFLADMHGLNIDCIEFDHLCNKKTIVYEIKIKKENGIEKRLNELYIYEFEVTEKDLEEIEKFIFDKISLLERFENCPSNELPLCSDSERWADGEKWAVMKKGRKSAVRVFDTESDAKAMLSNLDNLHFIEHRPPIARKCADYCLVCDFCNQYQNERKRLENES